MGLHGTKLPLKLAPYPVAMTTLLGVAGLVLQETFEPLLLLMH